MNSWSANERASGYCFFIIALQIESSQIGWVFFHAPHKILTASFTLFYYCITNSELSWETLEQRRAKTRAVLVYKIINNLVDIPSHTLLIPADGRTRGTTQRTILTWSHIPQELRLVPPSTSSEQDLGLSLSQCSPKCK